MSIIRDGFQSADLDVPVVSPTLNLDFANSQELDPRITFSRGSIGTFVNKNGLIETAPTNQPRFDYDPISGECRGLLIEESRVNGIRNNTMVGAVVGAPGTVPTNWSWGASQSGVVREIIATGVEDGISYIDVRFSGKATGNPTTFYSFSAESSVGNFPGTNTSRYTFSTYFKLISGIIPSGVSFIMVFNAQDASFVNLNEYRTLAINLPSTKRLIENRFVFTNTDFVSTSTAYIRPYYQLNVPFNTYVDLTIRIGMPQVELGSFVTSIIPTSGSTVTRTTEIAQMRGTNFSSWYNSSEGTIKAEYIYNSIGTSNQCPFSFDNGTNQETIVEASSSPNIDRILSASGGVTQANLGTYNYSLGQTIKRTVSYGLNNFRTSANGSSVSSDISYILPTPTQLSIGHAGYFTSSRINGCIKRFTYYPKALSPAQLQYLTQ